jgi:hypothetical protein
MSIESPIGREEQKSQCQFVDNTVSYVLITLNILVNKKILPFFRLFSLVAPLKPELNFSVPFNTVVSIWL